VTYEYLVVMRRPESYFTSLREEDSLGRALNSRGAEGWRLRQITPLNEQMHTIIFEREVASKPS
jgi:hypothetical protein